MSLLDPNSFSVSQMTSNSDGKSSASGAMGVLICTIGSLCFFIGCLDNLMLKGDSDIMTQSIIFTGIGAGLLGYRKFKDDFGGKSSPVQEEPILFDDEAEETTRPARKAVTEAAVVQAVVPEKKADKKPDPTPLPENPDDF